METMSDGTQEWTLSELEMLSDMDATERTRLIASLVCADPVAGPPTSDSPAAPN